MNLMCGLVVGVIALSLVACNRSGESSEGGADSNVVQWADIPADTINVPRGVTYNQVTIDGATIAEVSGVPENAGDDRRTGGVSVRLPDSFEQQASGAQVRVTVRAMSPHPGAVLGVAYSTAESGNSGWREFTLSQTPTDYSFAYTVPRLRQGNGDFVGFRSYGDNTVQIVSYGVAVEEAAPPAPAQPAAQPAAQPTAATDELRP